MSSPLDVEYLTKICRSKSLALSMLEDCLNDVVQSKELIITSCASCGDLSEKTEEREKVQETIVSLQSGAQQLGATDLYQISKTLLLKFKKTSSLSEEDLKMLDDTTAEFENYAKKILSLDGKVPSNETC